MSERSEAHAGRASASHTQPAQDGDGARGRSPRERMSEPSEPTELTPAEPPTKELDDDGVPERRPRREMGDRKLTLRVRNLRVDYEIFEHRRAALRQRLVTGQGSGRSLVQALKGVSFDAYEGDAVGVIGSNGSGKSTLLATIAGLLTPTAGRVLVADEPKLLGVGATLMPGASGYRNIRLGCLALGMTSAEVDDRIDEIVDFTELGEAIHRPLRTYSSGMRARLHFAIATSVRPRILLIDEALGAGDRRFRKKSSARIAEMLDAAGTLMFVSHGLGEVRRQCTRALWIEKGVLRADGDVDEVVDEYTAHSH
jgi:teichoic acid transport system ATP-binding protein